MKKVSTVATKPSRNNSQPTLTIGLDLGDRNSWYCVLDEAGQIQVEQRVRTHAKTLGEVFGAMPRSRVVLETGTHSPGDCVNRVAQVRGVEDHRGGQAMKHRRSRTVYRRHAHGG